MDEPDGAQIKALARRWLGKDAESLIEAVLRLGDVVLRRHQLGWDRTLVVLLLALLGVGGGVARPKAHSSPICRSGASGSGGRPSSTRRALASLKRLLAGDNGQAECAKLLGVSVRTIGRTVARTRPSAKRRA